MRRPKRDHAAAYSRRLREPHVRSMTELAGSPSKPKRLNGAKPAHVALAMAEAAAMKAAGDFTLAEPRHVVALYALLHRAVYKVDPAELKGTEWTLAVLAVRRLVKAEFNGVTLALVELLRWTWQRELRAHQKANGSDRRRLGWRLQFSPVVVTDYRMAKLAERGPGRR